MKLLLGSAAAAGMLVAATAANAQALSSYLVDEPVAIVSGVSAAATRVLTAATNVGARMLPPYGPEATTVVVSDMQGSYPVAQSEPPPRYMPPGAARYVPPVLSPDDIDAIARDSGFSPLGAPQQRGFVYTMSAINPYGEDGRLVFDARNGRILRFMPAYRMGGRMNEEITTTYGPVGPPPSLPQGRSDYRPDYRGTPRVASRTPNVPLPKAAPPRAVATLPKPVAAVPAATPAPAEQSASIETKPAETTGTAPATPTVASAPVGANPSEAKLSAAPASEAKPSEVKPAEVKATDAKPSADTKPETVAAVPTETNASETQPSDNKSSADAKPATPAKPAASEIQATKPMPPVQGLE